MSCLFYFYNRQFVSLNRNGDIPIPNFMSIDDKNYCLRLACRYGYKELAKKLIEKGVNDWNEAYYEACRTSHSDLASMMIMGGVTDLYSGILIAYLNNDAKLKKTLLTHDLSGVDWNHSLMISCFFGHIKLIKYTISKGSTNFKEVVEDYCRTYANHSFFVSRENHNDVLTILLMNGGQIDPVPELIKSNLQLYRLNGIIDNKHYDRLVSIHCPIYLILCYHKKSIFKRIPIELIKVLYLFNVTWRKK